MNASRGSGAARRTARRTDVPDEVARALDESARDLHEGRVEDAASFLDRMRVKIERYFERKAARRPKS